MDNVVKGALLILLAIVGAIGVGSFIFVVADLDVATPIKNAAGIAQALAAVAAVVLGGVFAYRNGLLFRTFEPHLTITQDATHRRIGDQYVHIAVTATLHNSSRVQVEIRQGFFRLQQVAPIDDNDVEALYAQAFGAVSERSSIQWPVLDEWQTPSPENLLLIEPGQSHQEHVEFIVNHNVTCVLIYSCFYNSAFSESSQPAVAWAASTVYDVAE